MTETNLVEQALTFNAMWTFKKGSRVQFVNKDEGLVVGTVKSINKFGLAKIVQDGGKYEWKVGAAKLKDGPPLPKDDPSPMDKWSVTDYKCIGGDETPMYAAKVRLNGKVVGESSNGGTGGSDNFYFSDRGVSDQFYADVKAWWVQMGGKVNEYSEVEGLWVDWYANHKPVGITAKAYVADYNSLLGA
jgi:hypothetical protein